LTVIDNEATHHNSHYYSRYEKEGLKTLCERMPRHNSYQVDTYIDLYQTFWANKDGLWKYFSEITVNNGPLTTARGLEKGNTPTINGCFASWINITTTIERENELTTTNTQNSG